MKILGKGYFWRRKSMSRERMVPPVLILQEVSHLWHCSLSLSYWDVLWESLLSFLYKRVLFFLWCLERGACKSKVEMLQNKQGHTKKPNHYYLFFFFKCDFVFNFGENCIWKWRGKGAYFQIFIIIIYIFYSFFCCFEVERERLGCIAQDPLVFFPLVISVHPVVPIFLTSYIPVIGHYG